MIRVGLGHAGKEGENCCKRERESVCVSERERDREKWGIKETFLCVESFSNSSHCFVIHWSMSQ